MQKPDNKNSTRVGLILAASSLMKERDSLEISLSDIAERAQANSALVRYYFGSKEGLLFAVLEYDVTEMTEALSKLLSSKMPPDRMMRIHLTGLINTYRNVPYTNRLVHALTRDSGKERAAQISNEFIQPIIRAQKVILDNGYSAGYFRKIDPKLFYFQALGAADCLYQNRFTLLTAFGIHTVSDSLHRKNVKQVVGIIMRGIENTTSN